MIKYYWPVFIVGLPAVNHIHSTLNKLDYTTPIADCQTEKQTNTLEYNYITTEKYLESQILKHQDIMK